MTQTAELELSNEELQPETLPAELPGAPMSPPLVIKPEMAKLLELTQANGSSTTAKEINAQLDRVLRDYDELTALYAENNRRIDGELAEIRHSGGTLSGRVHQISADLQRQSLSLTAQATAAEQRVDALRGEMRSWLADTEQRWDTQLASSNACVQADLLRMDAGIGSLDGLLKAQEQILAEQRARLDQFDIAYQLLDTATRGNKSRIEAVREQAEKQQAILEAQLEGLSALQREHYAEFRNLQGLVGALQTETQRLDEAIGQVAAALAEHSDETRNRFKKTHLAIAGLLVSTVVGFALVKWLPAFAPESTESAIAQQQARITEVSGQVAALSAREAAQPEIDARQQADIDRVSGKVLGLEKSLAELRAAFQKLKAPSAAGAGVLHDSQWLLQQDRKAYTVQLVASPSKTDMARFIDRNKEYLTLNSLAFSVTERDQRESYNLFYGVFATVAQARAAIVALPAELRVSRPWVRPLESVQDSLR